MATQKHKRHGFLSDGFVLILNKKDNVGVLLRDVKSRTRARINEDMVEVNRDIAFGHKVAIRNIPKDGYVIKYGIVIGRAKCSINKGEHVHVHNVQDITEELRDKALAKIRARE